MEDPVTDLSGQVQASAVALKQLDDPKGLLVVPEAPPEALVEDLVQDFLSRVAERRMSEVMAERNRFRQVLVEAKRPRHGARDPGRLERMGQPCPVVVAFRIDEDLR